MATVKAIILDTETHALNGNPIEIAYYPLSLDSGFLRSYRKNPYNERFNPLQPIDLGSMSVHNILDEDLTECRPYTDFKLDSGVLYLVGHNIDYDLKALRRCGVKQQLRPIDTLALARTLVQDAPNHKLTTLSYYFAADRRKVREYIRNAHSALTDVDLTMALLTKLLPLIEPQHKTSWESLYLYSLECRIPKVMPFGEHVGKSFEDVPASYQSWIMKNPKMDIWLKLAIQLNEANMIRRTYEISHQLAPGTYQDHQFLYSREPEPVEKMTVYEATLLNGLRDQHE